MSGGSKSYLAQYNGEAPEDVNGLAYGIMFFLGVGNLFPWNAFITASSYYANRFCGTSFESNFENYFSFMFTFSQTFGLALSIIVQDKLTFEQKIIYPLILYSIVFTLTTALVGVQDIDANLLFYITSLCACLCGLSGAILSSGLYGLGAMLPEANTAALMNGSGFAGLAVSLSALITTLAAPRVRTCSDDNDTSCNREISYSALAYFIIATLVLLSNVMAYIILARLPFVRFYIARARGETNDVHNPLIHAGSSSRSSSRNQLATVSSLHQGGVEQGAAVTTANIEINDNDNQQATPSTFEKVLAVYKQLWIPSVSVILTFTATIAIFPSLFVIVESVDHCQAGASRFSDDLFVPVLFSLFNLFDFIGRYCGGFFTCGFTSKTIWMASAVRFLFFPLILLCKIQDSRLPVVFTSDAWPLLFISLMAISNGYVATRCMIMGASAVAPTDSGLAGTIMIFSLTLGLLLGACSSFMLVFISQGSV